MMARNWPKLIFVVLLCFLILPAKGECSGKVYYGSRAGMQVSVVSVAGLDTAHAVIRTVHARADAIAFCREYIGKVTEQCIKEELAIPLNDEITANCPAGTFTDFRGTNYQFLGPNKSPGDFGPKYLLKDLDRGQIADGSTASGYPTNMSIFKALCPTMAPVDLY